MIIDLENYSNQEEYQFLQQCLIINQGSSEALAAHVILYKSLGLNKKIAIICMLELARRRLLGEEFDYENFIDTELKKIPTVQPLNINAFRGLLNVQQLSNLIKK